MSLSDSIKAAVQKYLKQGGSLAALERETGISRAAFSRFMSNERGISLETADALAKVLKLKLVQK